MGEGGNFGRQLAALLAETLRQHEAAGADAKSARTVNTIGEIFEGMESATAEQNQAFASALLDTGVVPDSLRPMLEAVGTPNHKLLGMVQQFFMWGVLMQLVSVVIQPFSQSVVNKLWTGNPSIPLGPQEAAQMAQRGVPSDVDYQRDAEDGGIGPKRFKALQEAAAGGLSAADLAQAWHRGIIDEEQFKIGLQWTGLRATDVPRAMELATGIPSTAEVMNAWLEGQIEEGEAKRRYLETGADPTWFQTAYDSNGEAPTPNMLGEMWKRGIIPDKGTGPKATTFEQGFLEGPWRNKWLGPMEQLMEYLPPPRTVTALFHEGSISRQRAIELLQKQGLAHDLAAAYTDTATAEKLAAPKQLAVSQVSELYEAKAINESEAMALWESLGYEAGEASFLRELADMKRVTSYTATAIGTVHTEYTNHTVERGEASERLDSLHVPAAQRNELLRLWAIERETRDRVLTEAQVGDLLKGGYLTRAQAIKRWAGMGYSNEDATLLVHLYPVKVTGSEGASKALTTAQIGDLYKKGTISRAQVLERWQTAGFSAEESELLLTLYAPSG